MPPKRPSPDRSVKEAASHENRRCEALGIVVPVEWDSSGNPSAWAISTYDENLYRIDTATPKGRALGSFLGRKIMLSGFLSTAGDGRHSVEVDTYVLLDEKDTIR